ncbi:hypothetical protein N7532_009959 [Penicillium argentinense]|uniref:Vegetative incompatibility protein HET-E-1 n=1 Tax=Penicillium argentinense TaxID=1131581 RepID=A0A9W9ENN3_9EURO|nr:uncharacterized protein N7532_009959 [Penicillium argentinense]KAJ5085188.1 hypothetical protein N7532_009959 [Penicillium argentinense]
MLDELASCINLPEGVADDHESLEEIIGLCGSFLTLRGRTISLVHQSAKDFLLREAVQEIFPDGEDIVHYFIFSKSLGAISRMLRRDIYSLLHPGYPVNQVNQPDPDPLASIRYACVYWVDQLCRCSTTKNATKDLQDSGPVGIFFRNDYLHWLEALSLIRSLSEGVASIQRLRSLLETLNIRKATSVKSFDNTNSYLETDNGTIGLSLVSDLGLTNADPQVPRFEGYSVSSDREWITWNSENLLWLPPEYRPHTSASSLSTICLGCPSG